MRHPLGFSFGPAAGESPVFSAQDSSSSRPLQNRGLVTRDPDERVRGGSPLFGAPFGNRLASPLPAASLSGHPHLPRVLGACPPR